MKTVSGKVLSSKPISLSKAASTLSSFVSTDTGASQAICAYLRRSLASFKELKQLHKELKAPRSERKRVRHRSVSENNDAETVGDNRAQSVVVSQEASHGHEPELETESTRHQQEGNNNENFEGQDGERDRKEQKKEKKGELSNFGEDGGEIAGRAGEGVEKESNNNEEHERKKKNNKKKEKKDELRNFREDGGEIAGRAGEGVEKESNNNRKFEGQEGEHERKKKKNKKKEKTDELRNFREDGGEIAGRAGAGVEKESNNNEKFEGEEEENKKFEGEEEENKRKKKKKKKKKKNKKKEKKDELRNFREDGGEIAGRAGAGVEKGDDSAEIHSKKKKDNNGNFVENGVQIEEGDAGVKLGNEEVKRLEKRKRKSGVLEDGGTDALEDQLDKKKKRRKS